MSQKLVLILLFITVVYAINVTRVKIKRLDIIDAEEAHRGDPNVSPSVEPLPDAPYNATQFGQTVSGSFDARTLSTQPTTDNRSGEDLGVRIHSGVASWFDAVTARPAYPIEDCAPYSGCPRSTDTVPTWISTVSPILTHLMQRQSQEFLFPFIIESSDTITVSFALRTSGTSCNVWVKNEDTSAIESHIISDDTAAAQGSALDLQPRLSTTHVPLLSGRYSLRVRVENTSQNTHDLRTSVVWIKGTIASTLSRNIRVT